MRKQVKRKYFTNKNIGPENIDNNIATKRKEYDLLNQEVAQKKKEYDLLEQKIERKKKVSKQITEKINKMSYKMDATIEMYTGSIPEFKDGNIIISKKYLQIFTYIINWIILSFSNNILFFIGGLLLIISILLDSDPYSIQKERKKLRTILCRISLCFILFFILGIISVLEITTINNVLYLKINSSFILFPNTLICPLFYTWIISGILVLLPIIDFFITKTPLEFIINEGELK